jgi:hypothetical protein
MVLPEASMKFVLQVDKLAGLHVPAACAGVGLRGVAGVFWLRSTSTNAPGGSAVATNTFAVVTPVVGAVAESQVGVLSPVTVMFALLVTFLTAQSVWVAGGAGNATMRHTGLL